MAIKFLHRTTWDRQNSFITAVFDAGTYRDRPLGEMHMVDDEIERWLADPAKYRMTEADCAELSAGLAAIRDAEKAEIWKQQPATDLDEYEGDDVEREDDDLA